MSSTSTSIIWASANSAATAGESCAAPTPRASTASPEKGSSCSTLPPKIVHITDWFPTLAGIEVPDDRVLDGMDQTPSLSGEQETSARDGFIYWNGPTMYGVKWRNFKMVLVQQKYLTDPALPLGFPHIVNLMTDPKEREPANQVYIHSWTTVHFGRLLQEFQASVAREPLIPAGAPVDFVPTVSA